ncbi:type III effector [Pseudomonas syringae pv. tomato]|uniref:NAD(+)--protein-arginine ADP-ribosyltransferase n=2 Tax=Pseudomonas syringae group genomosp. 3 TaxID=251701 RepID=A0AAQ0NBY5_PSEUB|nr:MULTISPECIES: ADP-ribosyltransferase domain-containing protein [Pseudomonas syringae group]AVI86602.1 type III effector [Pseudomonas syringae pv. tomato]EEB62142.1 hopO1-3 [Pseudomonas syringae pv. tomato T1]KUR41526.1 NAD:arginine ADP-ribosyltransferase [Pseudomonas syringae pv. tomato]KUR44066.1 NAD:arginine ADP-ribosyltransferase [Pseudomonas syringae pv. tomato]MDT3235859.1 ADP-ribosyltransferase domain-containing protein [Pseudomonas syringae pv. tomato]
MNINPSLDAHGSAYSSPQSDTSKATGKAPAPSFFKQLGGCFSPCLGSHASSSQQLSASHAQTLSQNYSSNIQGTSRTRQPRAPSPRLSDTPMKQALSSMIERERLRLQGLSGGMFSGIDSADAMIGRALTKKDSNPKAARFSDDEFLAVHLYTTCLYRPINHHLRYQHQDDVPPIVEALKSGLAKLARDPEYQVAVPLHRGIEKTMSDEEVMKRFNSGRPYRDEAFMSTSTDSVIANSLTSSVTLHLQSTSAVNVSPFAMNAYEKEAIIPPQTPFEVVGLKKMHSTWHVDLKEVQDNADGS